MTEKQRQENKIVEAKLDEARELLDNISIYWQKNERLYQCSAVTFKINNLIFLKSYNTIIACIDKDSDTCYDWLRLVYGYTATSAQHIRKFMNKYGIVRKKTWHD